MKKITFIPLLILSLIFLDPIPALANFSETIVAKDPLTGESVLNNYTLEQENQLGEKYIKGRLNRLRKNGVKIDHDQQALERIRDMTKRIIKVSHLPDIPNWEIHITDKDIWNASAAPGGKILVHEGLYSSISDTKLAAVLSHEVAHVTARHSTEDMAHKRIVGTVDEDVKSAFYETTFSTNQEDEADRVGILYMALAGYDPMAAHELWYEQYQTEGNPKHFFKSTHPVNKQRASNTKEYAQKAKRYYVGPGKINPNYESFKKDNALINYDAEGGPSLVDAGMDAWIKNLASEELAEDRKRKHELAKKYYEKAINKLQRQVGSTVQELRRARQVIKEKRLRVDQVGISERRRGRGMVVHARLQNRTRGANLENIKVKFYYVKTRVLGENEVLGTQTGTVDSLPAQKQTWINLQPKQNVYNYDDVTAQVVDFELPKIQEFAKKLEKYRLFYKKKAMRMAEKKAEEETEPDDVEDAVVSKLKTNFLKEMMD